MIYFDNAATTKNKPPEVLKAYTDYITEVGVSPGRGSYSLGITASRMLYKSRMSIAKFFGLSEPNVIFTKNSTEAINMFFRGFLSKGDHVIISCYEHNAVLRPLEKMREEGLIQYSVVNRDDLMLSDEELISKYCNNSTKLLAFTLASNVTGRVIFRKTLFKLAKEKGITTLLDASQGAGKIRLNMETNYIDFLAFTGHKDLKGLPGIGGLCSLRELEFQPIIQGGTGVHGHEKTNPQIYPECYEAGTLNMPAIWALKTAVELLSNQLEEVADKEQSLVSYLLKQLQLIDCVEIYDKDYPRVGTIGFSVKGYSSNEVVKILDQNGICARGGIHCAILTHETLGTIDTGIVRISVSDTNTKSEVDDFIASLKRMENR